MKTFIFDADSPPIEFIHNLSVGLPSTRVTRSKAKEYMEVINRILAQKKPIHNQLGRKAMICKRNDQGSLILYRGYIRAPRRNNLLWHQTEAHEHQVPFFPDDTLYSRAREFYNGQRAFYFSRCSWATP